MAQNRLLTLLSDFGLSDVYVGVMKGVIAQINPTLTIVDITHEIPPQNVAAGRFCLMNAYPYFPDGTVHVAVVDPGVGSHRRAIAVQLSKCFLVGPDNGLFSGVLSHAQAIIAAVELTNTDYWRTTQPSTTFHGRDIFAPVGAHLAGGVPLEKLGRTIDPSTLVQLPIPECTQTEAVIIGCIQYIDNFGNLITNIPGILVKEKTWTVAAAGISIPSDTSYSNSQVGVPIALVSSGGWVEIAINSGNAHTKLQLNWGDAVQVMVN